MGMMARHATCFRAFSQDASIHQCVTLLCISTRGAIFFATFLINEHLCNKKECFVVEKIPIHWFGMKSN